MRIVAGTCRSNVVDTIDTRNAMGYHHLGEEKFSFHMLYSRRAKML